MSSSGRSDNNNKSDTSWCKLPDGKTWIHRGIFNNLGIVALTSEKLHYPLKYELAAMKELELRKLKPKSGVVYIKWQDDALYYVVKGLQGKPVEGTIPLSALPSLKLRPESPLVSQLKPHFKKILEITAERLHTYELTDSKFPFKKNQFNSTNDPTKLNPNSFKKTQELINTLVEFDNRNDVSHASRKEANKKVTLIYNSMRREEIYFPFNGQYVYPWLSGPANGDPVPTSEKFNGFQKFVMSNCLGGPKVIGLDENAGEILIIKHNIKLYKEQKCVAMNYDAEATSLYETELEEELNKILDFVNTYSESKKIISCHLPSWDYILFGVGLLIRGRISLQALDDYFKIIFDLRDRQAKKIEAECAKSDIEAKLGSPFENLFGAYEQKNKEKSALNNPMPTLNENEINSEKDFELARQILEILEVPTDEFTPDTFSEETQKEREKKLVQLCLGKLQSNSYSEEQRKTWQHSIAKADREKMNTFEDMFKMGNEVWIAREAEGTRDYKTCAIHARSEKQIQCAYQEGSNRKNVYNHHNELITRFRTIPQKKITQCEAQIERIKKRIEEIKKKMVSEAEYKEQIAKLNEQRADLYEKGACRDDSDIVAIRKQVEILKNSFQESGQHCNEIKNLSREIENQESIIKTQKDIMTTHENELTESQRKIDRIESTPNNPAIFNITYMDTPLAFSFKNWGQSFYHKINFPGSSTVLKQARRNVGFFSLSVEQALSQISSPTVAEERKALRKE